MRLKNDARRSCHEKKKKRLRSEGKKKKNELLKCVCEGSEKRSEAKGEFLMCEAEHF